MSQIQLGSKGKSLKTFTRRHKGHKSDSRRFSEEVNTRKPKFSLDFSQIVRIWLKLYGNGNARWKRPPIFLRISVELADRNIKDIFFLAIYRGVTFRVCGITKYRIIFHLYFKDIWIINCKLLCVDANSISQQLPTIFIH